jgi:hypothetical protein
MKSFFLLLFIGIFLSFIPSLRAADEELTYQGIQYACTGVGESKEDPKWKTYPLKLMFTAGTKAYVADVSVTIQDSSGKIVLKVNCDSPWLLARLKSGNYSVTAQASGAGSKTVQVSVPSSGQKEMVIRFSEIPSQ